MLDEGTSYPFLYSMLVVRNGKLIGERYFNGAQSSQLRSVASVTKTVSSILVGQALADGKTEFGTAKTVTAMEAVVRNTAIQGWLSDSLEHQVEAPVVEQQVVEASGRFGRRR